MDLNLESMLMRRFGIRQICGRYKLKEEPFFRARGSELQTGLIATRAIVRGDQIVAVPVISGQRLTTRAQNPRLEQNAVGGDQTIRNLFRAACRRRSLPFTAEFLQFLECLHRT